MANSREAQFKHDTTEDITGRGFKLAHGPTMVSDVCSGKPHGPEKQRLAEVSDDDKLHFANGIADRIECDEAVMAQVRSHSEDQVMHASSRRRSPAPYSTPSATTRSSACHCWKTKRQAGSSRC